jgi:catechol 2,3-dioxygenase-like lactoylglutathione lyase family enzyme
MNVTSITPILYVEEIEPCVPFWTERLGFTKAVDVPEGDRSGFVILQRDKMQVMYQTRASVQNDVPSIADTPMRGSILFIEVDDIDAVERAVAGAEVVVPRRRTFYGADELFVRDPAGNLIGFAEFKEAAPTG